MNTFSAGRRREARAFSHGCGGEQVRGGRSVRRRGLHLLLLSDGAPTKGDLQCSRQVASALRLGVSIHTCYISDGCDEVPPTRPLPPLHTHARTHPFTHAHTHTTTTTPHHSHHSCMRTGPCALNVPGLLSLDVKSRGLQCPCPTTTSPALQGATAPAAHLAPDKRSVVSRHPAAGGGAGHRCKRQARRGLKWPRDRRTSLYSSTPAPPARLL